MATFACIQLIRKGALVPSLHSPNTHLEALYCHPLLTRSKCRRVIASTSKASALLLEKPCAAPSDYPGRVDFARQTRCTSSTNWGTWTQHSLGVVAHVSCSVTLMSPFCFLHLYLGSVGPKSPTAAPIPPATGIPHSTQSPVLLVGCASLT